jgi:hypothetical protein
MESTYCMKVGDTTVDLTESTDFYVMSVGR